MNRWIALAALLPGGFIALAIVAVVRWRRRGLAQEVDAINAAIAERGHTYRFEGHDEALEQRTQARRKIAESVKKDGRRIETRDDRASRIHLMGR